MVAIVIGDIITLSTVSRQLWAQRGVRLVAPAGIACGHSAESLPVLQLLTAAELRRKGAMLFFYLDYVAALIAPRPFLDIRGSQDLFFPNVEAIDQGTAAVAEVCAQAHPTGIERWKKKN